MHFENFKASICKLYCRVPSFQDIVDIVLMFPMLCGNGGRSHAVWTSILTIVFFFPLILIMFAKI